MPSATPSSWGAQPCAESCRRTHLPACTASPSGLTRGFPKGLESSREGAVGSTQALGCVSVAMACVHSVHIRVMINVSFSPSCSRDSFVSGERAQDESPWVGPRSSRKQPPPPSSASLALLPPMTQGAGCFCCCCCRPPRCHRCPCAPWPGRRRRRWSLLPAAGASYLPRAAPRLRIPGPRAHGPSAATGKCPWPLSEPEGKQRSGTVVAHNSSAGQHGPPGRGGEGRAVIPAACKGMCFVFPLPGGSCGET